ncbi:MAG TPA: hypothetical protein VFI46_13570 [Jiangellaceae bacterium]|nr:hypothetical protein [Jiangellaceae bacterium]
MTLRVDRRFRGPSDSGNGGYVCGLVAARAGASVGGSAAEVTLRSPPPLDTAMSVVADGDGAVRVWHGDVTVAEGVLSTLTVDPVPPVDAVTARAVSASYPGLVQHPFPECFVCGSARAPGDGLRLFPGRLGDGRTACTWTVSADLSGRSELVWAALDCPGGWSAEIEGRPMVLGRMTAQLSALPDAGEECVVMGRLLGGEGRKTWTATTAYGVDGRELGRARATWLAITI